MDIDEGQVKILKQYIQRQELLLLDFIRKTLELETKIINLNVSLQEITQKYEESQTNVAAQNDLMSQAAASIESLTVENKRFKEEDEENKKTINGLKKSLQDCLTEKEQSFRKNEDLIKEYKRQVEDLNKLSEENKELCSKQQPLNKKKSKAILPPDEF